MDWLKWLIPVVVVAVWILSHLAAEQQPRQKPAAPPRPLPPRDPNEGPSPRRASEELEQFLEDAKRRRQAEEVAAAEPVYVAQEIPPPRPRPVDKRRSVAIGSKPSQRRADPVIVCEQLSSAPESKPRSVAMPAAGVAAPQALQAPPPGPVVPQALHRPEALPTKSTLPPAAKIVRELLKSRQTLRAAFLLREILDEPLCKRRR